MKTSENITKIAEALFQFQSKVEKPKKDGENPHFRSKYATLDSVIDTIRPAMKEAGLILIQDPIRHENEIGVRTRIIHRSGEWIEFEPVFIPAKKLDGHGIGSALTYARRYALSTALGLATESDDDANAASADPQPQRQQAKREAQQLSQQLSRQRQRQQTQQQHSNAQPDQQSELATQNQLKAMFASARSKLTNNEIKEMVKFLTGKSSSKELTKKEASELIEHFNTRTKEELLEELAGIRQVPNAATTGNGWIDQEIDAMMGGVQ